jgi:hypothetical protein
MSTARISAAPGAPAFEREPNGRLISARATEFHASYCRRAFMVTHALAGHPLFELPRLIELAKHLPEEHVKYNAGNIPVTEQLYGGPHNGLSVEETIRRIEECGSWMVLKFVETDEEYAALLNRCLDDVERLSEPSGPATLRRQGFIFITSPRSVTPYHCDPEHGFLLQVRGRKMINVVDESQVSCLEYEKYFAEGDGPHFREECREAASAFVLDPGSGVHIPFAAPHWVENGEEVSVSFSITYRTAESELKSIVHKANHGLRRRGLSPRAFGESRLRDSMKFLGFRALRKAKGVLRIGEPGEPQNY